MTQPITAHQIRLLRLRGQRLAGPGRAGGTGTGQVAQVARDLCGIQAQDTSAAALAVRARCPGLVAPAVEQARTEVRTTVRAWLMRGTLHLVAAEDLDWLLALLAPRTIRSGRRRRAQLGLDEDTGARGVQVLQDMLAARGPSTRAEIRAHLAAQSIPSAGQATIHLIGLAALQGILLYGPDRDGEETFVLRADWLDQGERMAPEQAAMELVRRYLAAYGPATPRDCAAWCGLPLGQVRAAWQQVAGQLVEVQTDAGPAWMLLSQAPWLDAPLAGHPQVNLLPAYDTYLLGYRSRELVLPAKHTQRIYPGGGLLRPALLVDGRAAGSWKLKRLRHHVEVNVTPFEDLAGEVWPGLEQEIADLAHFLGTEVRLAVSPPAPEQD